MTEQTEPTFEEGAEVEAPTSNDVGEQTLTKADMAESEDDAEEVDEAE